MECAVVVKLKAITSKQSFPISVGFQVPPYSRYSFKIMMIKNDELNL